MSQRTQVMEHAAAVSHAAAAHNARTRLAAWSTHWREQAPQAVATLERDGEHTRVFSTSADLAPRWLRTTSLVEHPHRE